MNDEVPNASDSADNESDNSEAVELLVAGRERRKTAGNRYDRDTVLEDAKEEEPDEVTLLFAADEEEEDEEFRSEASDEDEMSSSDDDDQGPNAGAENLEGEKELENQAKEARAKKRKAELALTSTAGLRKRSKLDPTQSKPIPKKPSKKKERLTWVPDDDNAAARSSLRKQTIVHREETLARLKESEAQSKKLKALKEQRDKEKAKNAPKAMTQADRLAEAERVERRNAKSLNRWEAMEKKRTEEQAAKLAALKNRKLEGPVVTLWSGKAYWRGPRPSQVWKEPAEENSREPKKRGRKPKGYHEHMAALRAAGDSVPVSGQQSPLLPSPVEVQSQPRQASSETTSQPQISFTHPQGPTNFFLPGIHEYASMQSDATETTTTNVGSPNVMADESTGPMHDLKVTETAKPATIETQKEHNAMTEDKQTIPVNGPAVDGLQAKAISTGQVPTQAGPSVQTPLQQLPAPPLQPVEEGYTTKNLVILDKFDDLSETSRQDYGFFFNSRKSTKPIKHNPELCPITMHPARYRDPATGIGYANMFAYKVLQELKEHKFTWSSMLGCYVGREGIPVARGVPEGFAGG